MLLHGLGELGYVYGQHFVTEPRGGEGRPGSFPSLAAELVRLRVDVIVAGGPTAWSRLPAMYELRQYVEAGGLISYSADLIDIWRRAAAFVDKILKGAKPADLPVEQPTKFELVINLKTAKTLGLTVPPSILLRADGVIQ
jgi:ABC transporter substrate binding protein